MALVPFPGTEPIEPHRDPDTDTYEQDELEEAGGKMSFLEHLDELRKRLLVSVLSLLGGFVISLYFSDKLLAVVMKRLGPFLPGGRLITTEPTEGFMLQMKVAALAGLFLALPVILWQLWRFVAPGLYSHEKKFAVPFVFFATFFFAAGAVFAHVIAFPWAFRFFAGFSTDYLEFTPRGAPTFSLYVKMLLAFGIVFQMPTVVFFLARVGGITSRFLIRNTKYAILIIFIIAAVLSPGTDPVSQIMMAGPMLGLYAISIVIAWIFQKRSTV